MSARMAAGAGMVKSGGGGGGIKWEPDLVGGWDGGEWFGEGGGAEGYINAQFWHTDHIHTNENRFMLNLWLFFYS